MKVMCTNHENHHPSIPNDDSIPKPDIGDIVTVIDERTYRGVIECYILQEYMSPSPIFVWLYDKKNFSPLSNIDEVELVNTKEEVYG